MASYIADRDLKGIDMDDLGKAQGAAVAAAERLRAEGVDIRYVRSTFAPDTGRCMCLFEAEDERAVRRLNDEAGLPYREVVRVLDLHPPG